MGKSEEEYVAKKFTNLIPLHNLLDSKLAKDKAKLSNRRSTLSKKGSVKSTVAPDPPLSNTFEGDNEDKKSSPRTGKASQLSNIARDAKSSKFRSKEIPIDNTKIVQKVALDS